MATVLLPEPDGPTMPMTCPADTLKLTSCSTSGSVDAVAEHDMLERHVAADGRQGGAGGIEPGLGRRVENVAEPRHREPRLMEILPDLGQPQHRLAHPSGQHVEGDQLAHRQVAGDDQLGAEVKNAGHDELC